MVLLLQTYAICCVLEYRYFLENRLQYFENTEDFISTGLSSPVCTGSHRQGAGGRASGQDEGTDQPFMCTGRGAVSMKKQLSWEH